MTEAEAEAEVRCGYPLRGLGRGEWCGNEPRPSGEGAGARPKYCGKEVAEAKPDGRRVVVRHTALTAFRRRQELERQVSGRAEPEDLGRPVTMATERAVQLRRELRADITALTGRLSELAAQLERAADPQAAEAQIEAVQTEAEEFKAAARAEVAREAQRRQHAQADAEEARTAAIEADTRLAETLAAKDQAEQAAGDTRAELAERTAACDAELRRVREEAAAGVADAQLRLDEAIAQARAEAEVRVRAAAAERDTAVAAARRQAGQAQAEAAKSGRDATRAEAAEAAIRAELARARDDAAREREQLAQSCQAQLAILGQARDELRTRAGRADRDLERALAERDQAARRAGADAAGLDRLRAAAAAALAACHRAIQQGDTAQLPQAAQALQDAAGAPVTPPAAAGGQPARRRQRGS